MVIYFKKPILTNSCQSESLIVVNYAVSRVIYHDEVISSAISLLGFFIQFLKMAIDLYKGLVNQGNYVFFRETPVIDK